MDFPRNESIFTVSPACESRSCYIQNCRKVWASEMVVGFDTVPGFVEVIT